MQPWNIREVLVILSGSSTVHDVKLVQPENVSLVLVILLGSVPLGVVNEVKLVQP